MCCLFLYDHWKTLTRNSDILLQLNSYFFSAGAELMVQEIDSHIVNISEMIEKG